MLFQQEYVTAHYYKKKKTREEKQLNSKDKIMKKKCKIFAVRHGETEWNKIEKQQGHLNSNLTECGKLQAKVLGDGLCKNKFDSFYTSDLGRAIETSEIISNCIKKDFIPDLRLRERHLGTLQGLKKAEFKDKYPDEWMKFNSNDPDYVLPGGESIRQRYERAIHGIEDIALHNLNTTF